MLKVMTAACTGKERRSRRGAGAGGIRLQGQRPFRCAQQAGTPPQPLSSGIHFQRPLGRHCVTSFPLPLSPSSQEQEQRIQAGTKQGTVWGPPISFPPLFFFSFTAGRENQVRLWTTINCRDGAPPAPVAGRVSARVGPCTLFFFTVREPGAIRCWSEREQRCWCCGSCEAKNQGPVPGRFPLAGFSRAES